VRRTRQKMSWPASLPVSEGSELGRICSTGER
jgi:hypothetical protein